MDDLSLQQLLVTNFGLSPSGYTGSVGATGPAGPAGGYTGSAGSVGYVGSAGAGVVMTVDTFTGDGSTTTFALTATPESINRTIVNYNGVTVLRSTYTLSQANVTFSSAPAVGSQLEITTINSAAGSGSGGTALKVSAVGYVGNNTATDVAGGETVSLTGTGFATGASVIVNGVAAGVVTVASATQLTFTAPAMTAGTYILYVVNPDGATAISVPGISYSGVPSFYVGAGSVGTVYEASSFNSNVAAVGDSAITYSIASGSLPSGATLNANGIITGSSVLTASPTTYTFGVTASDGQNQDVTRTYTITVNPDVVTWSSPTNGATIGLGQGSASSTTLTAVSAAGKAITYTANALPTGLSIVGSAVTGTPTVTGNTTTLLTATAASTTRTANVTVTWNIAVTGEPYFMYNSLLLSGNGTNNATNNTFVDSSPNNFAITRAGNTTQGTFSPYGANWSNYFDGTGDYLSIPDSSAFALGSSNFTMEAWVYPTATGNFPVIASQYQTGSTGFFWSLGPTANPRDVNFYAYYSGGNTLLAASNVVVLNTWAHHAVVRNSNTLTYYVNGVAVATAAFSNTVNDSTSIVTIGNGGDSGYTTYPFTGYISNLRMVKGTAVYTGNFTPSTTPLTAIANTILLTCADNRFIDDSANNFAITRNGDVSVQRFSPFSPGASYSASTIGGSAYFDGTGDWLTTPYNAAYAFGTGDFTVEFWVNHSVFDNYELYIGDVSMSTGRSAWAIGCTNALEGGNSKLYFFAGTSLTTYGATWTPATNTWYHIAAARSGTSLKLFVDGKQLGSTFTCANDIDNTYGSGTFYIGRINSDVNWLLNGYISNMRVVKGTAVYTSNFAPPTAPVSAVANTQLLLNFTNAGVIDGTMMNNLETVGDAKISTAQSKFGGSSMYFDGAGDYLFSTSSPNFGITNIFTVECWLYLTVLPSGSNAMYITDFRGGTTNNYAFGVINSGANTILYGYLGSIGGEIRGSTNITTGAWYHMAFVNTGSTLTGYLNGVSQGTLTTSFNQAATNLIVGARYTGATEYINGYIDDLRITKGYARYTANFTPPTTAFSQK